MPISTKAQRHAQRWSACQVRAQEDADREEAHLRRAGAPMLGPAFRAAWIRRRAAFLMDAPPETAALETIAARFFPTSIDACWDAADFAEISRSSLHHMLRQAFEAGRATAPATTKKKA